MKETAHSTGLREYLYEMERCRNGISQLIWRAVSWREVNGG
jgi:hypothetical protein